MRDTGKQSPISATADDALRIDGLDLRSLFDRFPFAVQVFTPDGQAIYRNPAQIALWGPRDDSAQRAVIFDSPVLTELGLMPLIRRGFSGESVALPATRYTTAEEPRLPEGRPIWVRTFIYPVNDESGAMRAVVVMHIDVTERETAQQRLEDRVTERTSEIATLLKVSQSVASTLELDALLRLILDQLKTVADYSGSTVIILEGDHFRLLDDRGGASPDEPNPDLIGATWPVARQSAIWQTIGRHEPVIIGDVRDDTDLARAFRDVTRRFADTPAIRHIRSWLGVPLAIKDRVIGLIGISKDEPEFYTPHHARLAIAIATHAAAAIENARLFEEERRTARELATLLEISRTVSSTLELDPLLGLILDQIKLVVDYTSAVVITVEGDDARTREYRGPLPREVVLSRPVRLETTPATEARFERGEPFIIADVWGPQEEARLYREQMGEAYLRTTASYLHCLLVAPLLNKGQLIGALALTHRVTDYYTEHQATLVQAIANQVASAIENARLFEQQRQTTEELYTLLSISRNVSSTLELEPLLGLILDQLKLAVEYTSATVATRELDRYVIREYRGPLPRDVVLSRPLPAISSTDALSAVPEDRPLIIPDLWADTPTARAYRAVRGEEYLRSTASYLRSMLIAPLNHKGETVGALTLTHQTPGFFTKHHAAVAQAVADQVAGAIENARLFDQQRQTAGEMASLVEVSRNLSSTLELRPLLELILDQTKVVAEYDGASIILIENNTLQTFLRRFPTEVTADLEHLLQIPLERVRPIAEAVFLRQPVIIDDIRGDEPMARAYREAMGEALEATHLRSVRSWMGIPLALKDRVIGILVLSRTQPNSYTRHHAGLVAAMAAQAAVAIENARLYEQAQKLAALEERQRLARDLHDSVSQVLFSIGLGARTTRTLLERGDPAKATPSVEYITNLAEMGMAEMRALLFELRPESLEQEGLVVAITKQVAALRARHGIAVQLDLCDEPETSLEVKEALYRIAQEATHNTVKHARASRIDVRLRSAGDRLDLEVQDDGRGFDPAGSFPGHLGLHSMRERVTRLGGTLDLESATGRGTTIRVRVPAGG